MDNKIRRKLIIIKIKGYLQAIFGGLIVFGGISVFSKKGYFFNPDTTDMVIDIVIILFFALVLYFGITNIRMCSIYEKYRSLFFQSKMALNLDYAQMADIIHKPVAEVKKDVAQLMINGLWQGVHGGSQAVYDNESNLREREFQSRSQEANMYKTVKCRDCHGTTKVFSGDRYPKCSYCESPLADEINGWKN